MECWGQHMWSKGTDLRDSRGVYRWAPIERAPEGLIFERGAREYRSITGILDHVFGNPDIAHAAWVAQEAQRLFALHEAKLMDHCTTIERDEAGQFVRVFEDVPPADRLLDANWLRKHGFRMSERAADRGTVVHEMMRYWHLHGGIHPSDVADWVDATICEGDGIAPYRCDQDEATAYCLSLVHFLSESDIQIIASEVPGFSDARGYACTLDCIAIIDGALWIVDAKTSKHSSRAHAYQLVAQSECDWYPAVGTTTQIARCDMFSGIEPRLGSLLIQPEKCTLRECTGITLNPLFDLYNSLRDPMPFKTVRDATTRTPEEVMAA